MSRKWVLRLLLVLDSGCCWRLRVMGRDRDASGEMRVRKGSREEANILFFIGDDFS
jgi:hypothetical protein